MNAWRSTKTMGAALGAAALVLALGIALRPERGAPPGAFTSEGEPSAAALAASGLGSSPVDPGATEPVRPPRAAPPRLRVVVRDGRKPLATAVVTIGMAGERLVRQTNGSGRVALRLRGPGRVSVLAEAPGYVAATAEAEVSPPSREVRLSLERESALAGRVVGAGGARASLTVTAAPVDAPTRTATAPVSSSGEFRIAGLASGTYAVALAPRLLTAEPAIVRLVAGQEARVDLELADNGRLAVGAALPSATGELHGATLHLLRIADHERLDLPLTVGADREALVEAVPAGAYYAELEIAGLPQLPQQTVDVAPDQTTPVRFTWPAGRIFGRVLAPGGPAAGAPIAAFKVVVADDGRLTRDPTPAALGQADAAGAYALVGLEPAAYVLFSQSGEAVGRGEVDLSAGGERELDLPLQASRILEARVLYRGKPVEGARVSAMSLPYAENARSGATDERGEVRVGALTPGAYFVRAMWSEPDAEAPRVASARVDLSGSPRQSLVLNLD